MKRFFAAVTGAGDFDFASIAEKKSSVEILHSDVKYGGVHVGAITMVEFDGDVKSLPGDLWESSKIAWVWKNSDGSYWLDTLSREHKDAEAWATNKSRLEALGTKLVPVQFALKK
jgi:hypothetical protein